MDTDTATKRKEPESEAPAADPAKKEPDTKTVAEPAKTTEEQPAKKTEEPDIKRARTVEPKTVRKQVEYYLSDDNLRHDKFFHEKISVDEGGWLEMSLILSCNKMKALKATKEDVITALKESKIEIKEDQSAVRRPSNAKLPALEAKPQHHTKKSAQHAHDGGVVSILKDVPAEQGWTQIKAKLEEALAPLPGKVKAWHVSEVDDKGQCFIACSPFEGDLAFFGELNLEVGSAKLKSEICYNDLLQQALKKMPKHVKDKRDNGAKKRQKERNKPILVGQQRFMNVGALRGKVKEILNSRSDGEQLKADGTDFKLIKALLEFHPKGAEKSKGLVGIKVAKSTMGDSRCFFMIREDGSEEDVSMMKCISSVEQNPPYVKVDKPAEKPAGAASSASAPADKAVTKAGEKPAETPADKSTEAASKTDEKPAEKVAEKVAEKPAEKPTQVASKTDEKPAEESAKA